MRLLIGGILLLVFFAAPGVILTRDPLKQTVAVSFYGLLLAILFFVFQAPDVALSQIAIGAVVLPAMLLLALTKMKRQSERRREGSG